MAIYAIQTYIVSRTRNHVLFYRAYAVLIAYGRALPAA